MSSIKQAIDMHERHQLTWRFFFVLLIYSVGDCHKKNIVSTLFIAGKQRVNVRSEVGMLKGL